MTMPEIHPGPAAVLAPDEGQELYLHYRRLREEAPVSVEPATGRPVLTRYADASAALKHPLLSSREVLEPVMSMPRPLKPVVRPAARILMRIMLFTDEPDHTRLRGLANRAFTPRVVEGMRTRIQAIANRLLDELDAGGSVDLIGGYANWLPVIVIAEMLGAPPADRRRIKAWSDDFALLISSSSRPALEVALRGARSSLQLQRYLRRLVRQRRANPGDTLLDGLIAAEESGDALTQEELIANAILLLVAGHISTTHLIGNGLLALLRHPAQLELLRQEPPLLPGAVEEFLRYESPFQWTGRVAVQDLELNGHPVRAGTAVAIGLGAANRDPAQFADPAFGAGVHFCLGAALARLEGQIGIGTVLDRFPDLRLAATRMEWRNTGVIRGLERLPVFLR
jgi:pimeloyl-[acyl-carrier protein] synthase